MSDTHTALYNTICLTTTTTDTGSRVHPCVTMTVVILVIIFLKCSIKGGLCNLYVAALLMTRRLLLF